MRYLTNQGKGDNLRTMKEIVEVAVGLPVSKTFHYRIPEKMRGSLQVGMRVLVPCKGRKVTGFAIDLLDYPPKGVEEKLLEVEDLLDEVPLIDHPMLRFYRWISDYYLYPLGEVIKTGLPPGLQLKSELVLSLTRDGTECLTKGGLEPIQEKVFNEIGRHGKVTLKKILKIFPEEVSRSQLFSWRRKGLLNIEAEVEDKEVKPKFEKVVQYRGGQTVRPLSEKQTEILKWVEEKGEISYSELSKKFKSPSKAIKSLHGSGLIAISSKEVLRDLSVHPEPVSYTHLTLPTKRIV